MPKSVVEEHDELMHYTSAAGLNGILTSQYLWATHSSFLNDSSEIRLFFERRLPVLIEAEVRTAFQELTKSADGARVIQEFGGFEAAVRNQTEVLARIIGETTYHFNEPYIVSFCSSRDSRVREHGLLSQWRGYGSNGGYAIVFDSMGLEFLLEKEARTFDYLRVQWGDVHYYDEQLTTSGAAEEINDAEEKLRSVVAAYLREPREDSFEPGYDAITTLSCLYKHWGFHEEREVRIVVVPTNESVRSATPEPRKPTKKTLTFIRDGLSVPYLTLFERTLDGDHEPRLPIRRVIVGPHRDSGQRKLDLEILLRSLNIAAEVHVSEIPYVGR